MSRAQRRASRGSARSRRTPEQPTGGGGGSGIPTAPIAVVLGIAVVVGLIAYLIWQQTQPGSSANDAAQAAEANASTDLPGEHVAVAEIYDGPYGQDAPHVRRDVDYAEEQGLPPAGGPHWGSSACGDSAESSDAFCGPVRAGFYRSAWDGESLVHNMEHSAVIVWYNTTDETIIEDLRDFGLDNGGLFNVVTFFPEMEEDTVAITSWSRRLVMSVSEFDRDKLQDFFDVHECRFDPESFCG